MGKEAIIFDTDYLSQEAKEYILKRVQNIKNNKTERASLSKILEKTVTIKKDQGQEK